MRLAIAVCVAACTAETDEPAPSPSREPTFEVAYLDEVDSAPATHIAVGGRMRVRTPEPATSLQAVGPFSITEIADDTFAITATAQGRGEIEIETTTGLARFVVSSAPIETIALRPTDYELQVPSRDFVFDATNAQATVALFDVDGKRLVDANLRLAGGSAPVSFVGAWDHIEFQTLAVGVHDVLVKTDTHAPMRASLEKIDWGGKAAGGSIGATRAGVDRVCFHARVPAGNEIAIAWQIVGATPDVHAANCVTVKDPTTVTATAKDWNVQLDLPLAD